MRPTRLLPPIMILSVCLAVSACEAGGNGAKPAAEATAAAVAAGAGETASSGPVAGRDTAEQEPAVSVGGGERAAVEEEKSASGVEGVVTLGPACPVERAGEPCPARPYSAELVIRDAVSHRIVATFSSGSDGLFRVELAPGDYLIEAPGPRRVTDPRAEPVPFRVEPGVFARVDVEFDSGVR